MSGSSCTGGQLRTFSYDSLSRLTSAVNPESGTTTYSYDDTSNLLTKSDPRAGTVTHSYDELHRITGTSYSGGGSDFSDTPAVTYTYSTSATSSCKNKHRLTAVSSNVSTMSYSCYDGLGHVTASSQQTGGTTYSFSYVYNLDDTLESVTYPSTRKLAYQYDAAGRLTAAGENTVGATDYASAISYKPHGGINNLTLGNGLYESWVYNLRLQPTEIKLGTSSGGSDKLKLEFGYGTTNNNGNVLSQTITRPSLTALTQTYDYDGANRLTSASESGAGTAWSRSYSYDVYGNRAVTANSGLPTSPLMPTALSNFSTSTNQVTLTGADYDDAGNLTETALGEDLEYDAENRLKSYTLGSTETTYQYGPQGRRVQKDTPTTTETYVYDAFGRLAAEYSTASPPAAETYYRTTDHLGSTRLVTRQDQSDAACYDFAPFGEEIPDTLGDRSSNACFAASFTPRHRFTGQERDDESDLDYFLARYYSGPLGRFLSPDAPFADQFESDPQSWNLYSYVRNNPLRFVDPTGNITFCATEDDPNCTPSDDPEGYRVVVTVTEKDPDPEEPAEPRQSSYQKAAISAIAGDLRRAAPLANTLFFAATAVAGLPSRSASGALTVVAASKASNFLKLNEKLLRAAAKLDPADKGGVLTKAGRALQKHAQRPDSPYPPVQGGPQQINAQAQEIVRGILNNPAAQFQTAPHRQFGKVLQITAPGRRGLQYTADGKTLIGFLSRSSK